MNIKSMSAENFFARSHIIISINTNYSTLLKYLWECHDYLWYVDIRDKGVELVDRVLVLIPQPGQPHAHPAASAHDRFQVLCVDLFPHTFSIFRICNYLRI